MSDDKNKQQRIYIYNNTLFGQLEGYVHDPGAVAGDISKVCSKFAGVAWTKRPTRPSVMNGISFDILEI